MKQKTALGILQSGRNVFLTGSAGTGKTFLINKYITYLRERGIRPAIVAPTGIAASHIGGTTIHSFFGVGIREKVSGDYIGDLLYRKYLHKRFKNLRVLIVDEISMVSPDLFNSMDKILRAFKYSDQPFGGVQVILSGDFFQLPPVSTGGKELRFVWQTELWQESDLKVCYLEEKFRQDDLSLINVLDEIRSGVVGEESREILRNCYRQKLKNNFQVTKLYTHNIDVDKINRRELGKIKSEPEIFIAQTKGSKKQLEKIFNTSLVSGEVVLKKGATVIFIKNNFEQGYINGTLGKVVDFVRGDYDIDEKLPIVKTFSGEEIVVRREEWRVENEKGEVKAMVRQIPLRLAWALTVHKSQGMTLDGAEIDLSRTFEVGQGYVALSRVKSVDGLRLMGANEIALQVDSAVLKIDRRMKELSDLNIRKWESFEREEKKEMKEKFIVKIGGTIDEEEIEKNKKKISVKPKEGGLAKNEERGKSRRFSKNELQQKKYSTIEITKKLLEQKMELEEVAQERELTLSTIQEHLIKIVKKYPEVQIDYLKPKERIIEKVKWAKEQIVNQNNKEDFLPNGDVKLKPIFIKLKKEISYEDIKLALLFMREE
jgi:GTPase SAR1 family protein